MTRLDLSDKIVEISIRNDGKVVWVDSGCVLRVCRIKELYVEGEMR